MNPKTAATSDMRRAQLLHVLPWMWLATCIAWALVLVATDRPAWPLTLWIATTVGPVVALNTSARGRWKGPSQ